MKSSFKKKPKKKCTPLVFGEGPKNPTICLIGESPGKEEVHKKRPFVGRSGKLLNALLSSTHLLREKLYITNLFKCPLRKKTPSAQQMLYWREDLWQEIARLKPRALICLGRLSSQALFQKFHLPFTTMKDLHGKVFHLSSSWGDLLLIALYHPAAARRSRQILSRLKRDFKKIKKELHFLS